MFILDEPVNYDLDPQQSLGAVARRLGVDAREYAYDVQLQREGRQLIYTPLFNFVDGNLNAVREMITSPTSMFGLSDGGAHCGAICDASMTTTYLTLWSRDRGDPTRIPLESVVHQLTRRPALHFGWPDRGLIAPGHLADLNVIDYTALNCDSPRIETDLPAGGRRLLQSATGYRFTIKRGAVTFEDGEATGALPGQLLRASP
ncbi:MAG TPA: amidohydrolase family protein, partial [Acidimicrobiales bacterium]